MSQWTLIIPDETDRMVRTHIAKNDATEGALSQFVERAVRKELLRETVKTVQDRNARFDQEELMNVVEEAVDWARADRS
jgi:hypothetical protein